MMKVFSFAKLRAFYLRKLLLLTRNIVLQMSSDVESDGQLVRQKVVSRDPDDGIERTSNKWIAAAYMITAIVGVGVLGVPQAMVYLHWFGLPTT
jgi:hypothetical protein